MIFSIDKNKFNTMTYILPIIFSFSWWFGDIGILWFLFINIWLGLNDENKSYSGILIYAKLTQHNLHYIPKDFYIISMVMMHIILFFTYWFIYNHKEKSYRPLIIGLTIISIIPNHYNPMHIAWWRLLIRLALYIFIVIRIKKQAGLLISKYLIWSWIFFVNEISWIIIPFQIVYDTYNYKIDINV